VVNHVNKNVCVLCDEVMQSPICALCQTDKVENWIDKKRVATIKEFRNEIRAFLDTVRRYNKLSALIADSNLIHLFVKAVITNAFILGLYLKTKQQEKIFLTHLNTAIRNSL